MQAENTIVDFSGRRRAIMLMILGSVCISFGALVIRLSKKQTHFKSTSIVQYFLYLVLLRFISFDTEDPLF